jgi:lipopolysaccharide heptosyltransferase II
MSFIDERIRFRVDRPADRMIVDRARRAARRWWHAARTPPLLLLGLLRARATSPPAVARVGKILVVRTDRLGDMALTTAALSDLRSHFRRAEITVLAPPGPLALLQSHPAVDRLVPLGEGGLPPAMVGRFDLAIDFTPDERLRGAFLVNRSSARYRAGFRAAGREAFFNLRGPRSAPGRHIVDLNRDLITSLGVSGTPSSPALFVTPEERGAAQSLLASLGAASPRVAVHPGGFYPTQRWSPERFGELITLLTGRIGAACIVVHGPGEEELARRVCTATPDALAAPAPTVRSLMGLVACCDLFIGNNSGPLHIAGALGVPTASVMGPTDPARFAPRGPADRVVRKELPCSPCTRGRCWHLTCLRSIEPEELLVEAEASLRALLERPVAR